MNTANENFSAFGSGRGISADFLKGIAFITMFLDHVGAVVLEHGIMPEAAGNGNAALYGAAYEADTLLRTAGRIAFPIFAFLLVEGFLHTRSQKKYIGRMALLAILSEIPFDCAILGKLTLEGQNVFWTLTIGLAAIRLISAAEERNAQSCPARGFGQSILWAVSAVFLAVVFRCDYGGPGIVLILSFYMLRGNPMRVPAAFAGFLLSYFIYIPLGIRNFDRTMALLSMECCSLLALPFLLCYNGKRQQKGHRAFFYLFYPVHLLILYFFQIWYCFHW